MPKLKKKTKAKPRAKAPKLKPFDPASIEIVMPVKIHRSVPRTAVLPLLRAVAKAEALPQTFAMNTWGDVVDRDEDHPCGTVACLAGTIVEIERPRLFQSRLTAGCPNRIEIDAWSLLGLDPMVAKRLFFLGYWPEKFRRAYGCNLGFKQTSPAQRAVALRASPAQRAVALRARVEYFIKTGK